MRRKPAAGLAPQSLDDEVRRPDAELFADFPQWHASVRLEVRPRQASTVVAGGRE